MHTYDSIRRNDSIGAHFFYIISDSFSHANSQNNGEPYILRLSVIASHASATFEKLVVWPKKVSRIPDSLFLLFPNFNGIHVIIQNHGVVHFSRCKVHLIS